MQPEETHQHTDPYLGEGPAAAATPPAPEEPTLGPSSADPVRDLNAKLDAANARAEEHYQALLRAAADAENARRRGQEEAAKARKFGIESFAEALLPVMDSLEAALADQTSDAAKLREGVELTLRQLASALERNRVTAIHPLGERFDPHAHQAISTQPDAAVPANHVAAVLQKGYRIADRVLRPALVAVSQGTA